MQNKETRFYNIGDLTIKYKGPAFLERENLSIFRDVGKEPNVSYHIDFRKNINMPLKEALYKSGYLSFYREEKTKCCIHLDEDKINILAKVSSEEKNVHFIEYASERAGNIGTNIILKLFDLPHVIIPFGGIFLHASYIVWQDQAILFTAAKQRGKSTQAKLWEEHNDAIVVNGDRALIRKIDGKWFAFGSPYCGTSRICNNITKPIRAIVILDQSTENTIRKADSLEAFVALMSGCTYHAWDKCEVQKVTDIAKDMIESIPFYKLACCPDVSAVKCLEEMLCQKETE